jgi:hypothetical protein
MANNSDDPFAIGSWDSSKSSTTNDNFEVPKESNPFDKGFTMDWKKVHEKAQDRRKDPNFDPFGSLLAAKGLQLF